VKGKISAAHKTVKIEPIKWHLAENKNKISERKVEVREGSERPSKRMN